MFAAGSGNGRHLWEFIRDLLLAGDSGDKMAAEIIRWENRTEGIFRIIDSKKVAYLWGAKKRNKTMTYEKLSRALRLTAQMQNYYLYSHSLRLLDQISGCLRDSGVTRVGDTRGGN